MDNILSDREFEVVEHIVYLGTTKEAAPHLAITERTLETHRKNIFRKLKITKLNELVLWYCGVKFRISEQIETAKKEIIPVTKKITNVAMCIIFIYYTGIDPENYRRNRRFRREVETEYLISFAPIDNK